MVDLGRQIRATQARQGGFSAHVLPGAVAHDGLASLIIYYPNTPPPATTISGVTVTDLGSPSPYNTVIFQGVNALLAPSPNVYDGPSYSFTATKEVFDLGAKPYTLEFWCRVGTIPAASNYSSYVEVILANLLAPENMLTGFILESESDFTPTSRRINVYQQIGESNIQGLSDPGGANVETFNHVAIQRHSELAYTAHYKGEVIESWNAASNLSLTNGIFLKITTQSENMPGASVSQIRLTNKALYGTSAFTPPTAPFFTPPA